MSFPQKTISPIFLSSLPPHRFKHAVRRSWTPCQDESWCLVCPSGWWAMHTASWSASNYRIPLVSHRYVEISNPYHTATRIMVSQLSAGFWILSLFSILMLSIATFDDVNQRTGDCRSSINDVLVSIMVPQKCNVSHSFHSSYPSLILTCLLFASNNHSQDNT
jgi:hypothetical protein